MQTILIQGGRPLSGTLAIHGSKNAALPVLTAAAAVPGLHRIENCPDIRDVHTTLEILTYLGASAALKDGTAYLDTRALVSAPVPRALACRMRSSVLFLGALLARFGRAEVPSPGGCVLGLRPLDQHLSGLARLGVDCQDREGRMCAEGKPTGGTVILRCPSVGATENLLLCALGASGPVQILGAAKEPEIVCLAAYLRACGAKIRGDGTSVLTIEPAELHSGEGRICPDRMEAATYLCAAAACGGSVTLTDLCPQDLEQVTGTLSKAGCAITPTETSLTIRAGALQSPGMVVTGPHPAFPTDAQAPVMAALLRAEGTTLFHETVFENRFRHVKALKDLGGEIRVQGQLASVRGVQALSGARMEGTDLRGAAAMVVGALGAEGTSVLTQAQHLERGYADLVPGLRALGAQIEALDCAQR